MSKFNWSSTASAGTSAVGGLFGALIQNRGARRRETWARKHNVRMWEKVNRYNHPIEQMKRLQDAGLNPNLIYGSSPGSAVGNAGAIAPGQAPEYKMPNFIGTGVNTYFDTQVKQAQSDNMEANALLALSQAKKTDAETKKTGYEADFLGQTIDKRVATIGHQETIQRIKALVQEGTKETQIEQMFSNLELTSLKIQGQEEALKWAKAGFGGSLVTQIAQAIGMDLRTEAGRAQFQTWARLAGFLHGAQTFSQIGKNIMQSLNPIKWGKPKAPKGTFIKLGDHPYFK